MKTILVSIILFFLLQQPLNYPSWFENVFKINGLDKKYELYSFLKPDFLEADFNGDGSKDVAVVIIQKSTKRKGILIIHSKSNDYFVFGAGTSFGDDSTYTDYSWADHWEIYSKKYADVPQFDKTSGDILESHKVKIPHLGILIKNDEMGAGCIIYWTGKKYAWVHQGE
jgi:hypothetical protein